MPQEMTAEAATSTVGQNDINETYFASPLYHTPQGLVKTEKEFNTMCQMKSAILLKDRVFMPDYDSHGKMLEELKIKDTRENAERLFVRAELTPPDGDVFRDLSEWKFHVDQDILPEWYVAEVDEKRMREELRIWAKEHIHVNCDGLTLHSGAGHYIKGGKDIRIQDNAAVKEICGNAAVEYIRGNAAIKDIRDSAAVEYIGGSATVEEICGNAAVKYIGGSATVKYIRDSAAVEEICGNAAVEYSYDSAAIKYIGGSAIVSTSPFSRWEGLDKCKIKDSATVRDLFEKVIYQAGDFKMVKVGVRDE